MELHRFFRYAIEKMCKEKKSLNHFKDFETKLIHTKPGIGFILTDEKP